MGEPDRPRHQLWSFAYLVVRRVLSLVVLVLRTSDSKEIEILALRHELEILWRQQSRPPLEPADRARENGALATVLRPTRDPPSLAPTSGCSALDVPPSPPTASHRRGARDADRADGLGQPDLGVPARPRRAARSRTPGRSEHDRQGAEGPRPRARPTAQLCQLVPVPPPTSHRHRGLRLVLGRHDLVAPALCPLLHPSRHVLHPSRHAPGLPRRHHDQSHLGVGYPSGSQRDRRSLGCRHRRHVPLARSGREVPPCLRRGVARRRCKDPTKSCSGTQRERHRRAPGANCPIGVHRPFPHRERAPPATCARPRRAPLRPAPAAPGPCNACAAPSWKCGVVDASEDYTHPPARGSRRADQRVPRRMSCSDGFSDPTPCMVAIVRGASWERPRILGAVDAVRAVGWKRSSPSSAGVTTSSPLVGSTRLGMVKRSPAKRVAVVASKSSLASHPWGSCGVSIHVTRFAPSSSDAQSASECGWRSARSLSETFTPSVPWTTVALGVRANQSFMAPHSSASRWPKLTSSGSVRQRRSTVSPPHTMAGRAERPPSLSAFRSR